MPWRRLSDSQTDLQEKNKIFDGTITDLETTPSHLPSISATISGKYTFEDCKKATRGNVYKAEKEIKWKTAYI